MPVLPLVASSRILPALNFALRRPSETMLNAARSFTDPPGLYHSALPNSVTPGRFAVSRSKRRMGVLPMRPDHGLTPAPRSASCRACDTADSLADFADV